VGPVTSSKVTPQHLTASAEVTLSPAAKALWVAWLNENAGIVSTSSGLAAGFYAKLPAHVARFALILHALWNPDDPRGMVSAERMEDAIELGEYFRVHIRRFLELLQTSAPTTFAGLSARIVRILRMVRRESDDGWATRSDLLRCLGNVTAGDLTATLNDLQVAGPLNDGSSRPRPSVRKRGV
jgi:hypothetical protein